MDGIQLKPQEAFQGENVFAWPRVTPCVGHASAGVPLVRLSEVDFVLVIRMRSRGNKKFSGIRTQTQIVDSATDKFRSDSGDSGLRCRTRFGHCGRGGEGLEGNRYPLWKGPEHTLRSQCFGNVSARAVQGLYKGSRAVQGLYKVWTRELILTLF